MRRARLEHGPKSLLDFFDQDMLQLTDVERFLFDHMIPCDREALERAVRCIWKPACRGFSSARQTPVRARSGIGLAASPPEWQRAASGRDDRNSQPMTTVDFAAF